MSWTQDKQTTNASLKLVLTVIRCGVLAALFFSYGCRNQESLQQVKLTETHSESQLAPVGATRTMSLRTVVQGLKRPVGVEVPPGEPVPRDHGRLFVLEQHTGRIVIVVDGKLLPDPFLDLGKQISRGHEQGLLGLAFHPQFSSNRTFYVNYTDRSGATRVVAYRVASGDANRADPTSAREVLHIPQPFANHNGGGLEFGPDGQLYVGTGDGGAGGDPKGHGQNRTSLLGKMLRIQVEEKQPTPKIVQWGLRNPWRFHFDAESKGSTSLT